MYETKVGDEPHAPRDDDHSGSQESKPQPGERFSTLLEIFLRGGVIPSSLCGSDHSSRWKRRLPGNTRDHGIPLVTSVSHNRFTSSRLSWISSRSRFCSALPSEEYSPCFQCDRRDLAKPLRSTWARAGAAVHPTSAVTHCGRLTCSATTRLGATPRSGVRVTWRIPIFQPPRSSGGRLLIGLCLCHLPWKPFHYRHGARLQRSPDRLH